MHRKKAFCLLALLLLFCSCTGCGLFSPSATVDPHAGMVSVPDGNGSEMWVPLHEDLPVSTFSEADFQENGQFITYTGTDYTTRTGIDVSFYQGEIDWSLVAQSGIDFVMIRMGYRGYSEGELYVDSCFQTYIDGALAAGLDVGIYFFSQAISVEEAAEEAAFVLEHISQYPITMPVAFDWEHIGAEEGARTDTLDSDTLTSCCRAFCDVIRDAGYQPAVYFYRSLGYLNYDLSQLKDILFWFAGVGSYPDFYYAHTMWQYSYTAQIPGIENQVDLNLFFEPTDLDSTSDTSTSPITENSSASPTVTAE